MRSLLLIKKTQMDKLIGLVIVSAIVALMYLHHTSQILVVECTDGTFTEMHVFERMRKMNPLYTDTLECTYRDMRRGEYYDERSLRSYIKR